MSKFDNRILEATERLKDSCPITFQHEKGFIVITQEGYRKLTQKQKKSLSMKE
jgi:hypothetical protein